MQVRPRWPFRLRGGSADGLTRRRGAGIWRLLMSPAGEPALVAVVQPAPDRVLFAARAETEAAARYGIARMRFATAVDEDLRPFHERFRRDPVIGPVVRARPYLRVTRHPEPWVALAWAITEQLIEFQRALAIQRRMIARLGHRCPRTGLRVAPTADAVLGVAPAQLEGWDLAAGRARTLRHAAREVVRGRIDLGDPDHETAWRRLRAIPGVGAWTVEVLALYGHGRHDQVPAADLGFLKLVGRLATGNPKARADEDAARAFFAPYGEWKGLAGEYLRLAGAEGRLPLRLTRSPGSPTRPDRAPRPGGTRWSAPRPRRAAA